MVYISVRKLLFMSIKIFPSTLFTWKKRKGREESCAPSLLILLAPPDHYLILFQLNQHLKCRLVAATECLRDGLNALQFDSAPRISDAVMHLSILGVSY